jgi:membrane peptidoglycan carboxypeptidase
MSRAAAEGERVLSTEVAAVAREAMIDVVEQGTGRRTFRAVRGPDGAPLPIGAKTGTGNNRYRVVGRGGQVLVNRAINRTATVVFFIGDRFYGTITAFVGGAEADDYDFTSSLPVQILKALGPVLSDLAAVPDTSTALLERPAGGGQPLARRATPARRLTRVPAPAAAGPAPG